MSELVLGIDLGTSNSVAAVVKGGKVIVTADGEGRRVHPSVVSFHPNGSILVGQKAKNRRIIDPKNTIYSSKRLIGRRFRSGEVLQALERVPFAIQEGAQQQPVIMARGESYSVPEISALVLSYVRQVAEGYCGQAITKAVITVPANFNDTQREATRQAGTLAGLEVLRILNEPTAAALAYGYGKGMESRIAIFDFGGGTFDVTVLHLSGNIYEVLATAGDTYLGGDDIDQRLVEFMVHAFLQQHRVDLRTDPLAMERLRAVAEQVKIQLSGRTKAVVQVQEIARGQEGRPIDLSFSITREVLHQRVTDIVDRALVVCDEALRLCGLTVTQIDDVVLVGGTTRMPLVRERVMAYFGREPRADINPDEVVAIGAAIQGAALVQDGTGEGVDALLLDVTPRGLGIATVGGFADTIIQRNAQIPLEQTRVFATTADNQTAVKIQVCQGESRRFDENTPLGELVLDGLRAAQRGQVRVSVTFEIDPDGILKVRAQDEETGRAQAAKIQLLGTLSEEELADLVARRESTLGRAAMPAAGAALEEEP